MLNSNRSIDAFGSPTEPEPTVVNVLMSPSPKALADNPFLALLFAEAARCGTRISAYSRKCLLLKRYDVIHIHWPEWHVNWETAPGALFDMATFLSLIWLARLRCAAIVWTGHDL